MGEWVPVEGRSAMFEGARCDVLRIFKNGRVKIECWGQALLEGKRVKYTVSADSLSAPVAS